MEPAFDASEKYLINANYILMYALSMSLLKYNIMGYLQYHLRVCLKERYKYSKRGYHYLVCPCPKYQFCVYLQSICMY